MKEEIKLYRPSNGTEGDGFIFKFCAECIHDSQFRGGRKYCNILNRSLMYDKNEKGYPKQWRYDENGQPTCTKFSQYYPGHGTKKPRPKPVSGNQLVMFVTDEICPVIKVLEAQK